MVAPWRQRQGCGPLLQWQRRWARPQCEARLPSPQPARRRGPQWLEGSGRVGTGAASGGQKPGRGMRPHKGGSRSTSDEAARQHKSSSHRLRRHVSSKLGCCLLQHARGGPRWLHEWLRRPRRQISVRLQHHAVPRQHHSCGSHMNGTRLHRCPPPLLQHGTRRRVADRRVGEDVEQRAGGAPRKRGGGRRGQAAGVLHLSPAAARSPPACLAPPPLHNVAIRVVI